MLAIMIGTAALITVLSVFNGFEELVKSLYHTFNPDFVITASVGKTFDSGRLSESKIRKIPGVVNYIEVVEENALLKYKDEQYIVALKGVSNDYAINNPLDTMLAGGEFVLRKGEQNFAVLGYLVAYDLGINLRDYATPLNVYVPRSIPSGISGFNEAFSHVSVSPSGVFAIQQEIDSKYVIVHADIMRELLNYDDHEVSSIEIRLKPGTDYEEIQQKLKAIAGEDFVIKNRFQQQELLYKIMKSEKWAIYLILTFILLIAAFNIIGSLSMLIIDKRKDISVLFSIGANKKTIKKIFFTEGMLISVFGGLAGLALGFLLCWMQIRFGLIKLGDGTNAFIVSEYPVKMEWKDFATVMVTFLVIGALAAWYSVRQISDQYLAQKLSAFTKG